MRSKDEKEPIEPLSSLLQAQPLFADMATEQIQALAKSARHLRFGKGEKVISQNDPGQSMQPFSHRSGSRRLSNVMAGSQFSASSLAANALARFPSQLGARVPRPSSPRQIAIS